MAQHSKKDQIANAALTLFLQLGVKGTSVDMVVKASKVSKPTVYRHFPDKDMLLAHVVSCWAEKQPAPKFRARTVNGLTKELQECWLNSDALRLYGLFIGEGFRAPESKAVFDKHFDKPWREALSSWAKAHNESATQLNNLIDSRIFKILFYESEKNHLTPI